MLLESTETNGSVPKNLRMFVLHVPLQVELFELGEPAEAEEADDLATEVVAKIAFCPGPVVIEV